MDESGVPLMDNELQQLGSEGQMLSGAAEQDYAEFDGAQDDIFDHENSK